MDKREEILHKEFDTQSSDCRTWAEDIQLAITLNPDVKKIKNAMDEHAKQMSLEFLQFALQNMHGHSVDAAGNVEIKYNGEWITTEQLFLNFL